MAPNNVNYHLEYHMAAGIRAHNLGHMHRLLSQRGFCDGHDRVSQGYVDVLRRAIRA